MKRVGIIFFANVGIAIVEGKFRQNNESNKIYLIITYRVGLPVVSESGFPNNNIITESKLGF